MFIYIYIYIYIVIHINIYVQRLEDTSLVMPHILRELSGNWHDALNIDRVSSYILHR